MGGGGGLGRGLLCIREREGTFVSFCFRHGHSEEIVFGYGGECGAVSQKISRIGGLCKVARENGLVLRINAKNISEWQDTSLPSPPSSTYDTRTTLSFGSAALFLGTNDKRRRWSRRQNNYNEPPRLQMQAITDQQQQGFSLNRIVSYETPGFKPVRTIMVQTVTVPPIELASNCAV
ncbi:hypothetical protein B0H13DRAFT_1889997 [Mycena leptocephala]|nr:hypothetical protein B0H13DRAFT_1889997 [Mycena leptocephala]